MKRFKRICSLVLMVCMLPIGTIVNAEGENTAQPGVKSRDMDAYYVVNEDFSAPQPNTSSAIAPSGWDISDLGGTLGVDTNKSFTVVDSNEEHSVKMRRKFNALQDRATWEFTINPTIIIGGTRFELREDEKPCISLVIQDGKMTAETPQGHVVLSQITAKTIFGVKVEADIEKNTCTIWTDGKKRVENLAFLNACTQLDTIYIETGNEATGRMDIGTMRVSRGFSVNERFLTSTYELPEDWTVFSNGGSIAPEKLLGSLYPDVYSLKITDHDFMKGSKIGRTFSYEGEELWLEYQFLTPKQMKEFNMTLSMGASDLITLSSKDGRFGYTVTGEGFQPVYDLQQNVWYHAMIKLTKSGAKIYLNHKLLADNVKIPFLKVDSVCFETGKSATGELWLDDIIIKPCAPLPEDYVPEPVVPKKQGEYLVGMQSCNLWKEGSHYGWDWINPYEERIPYLGFYDDGNAEVKDWETKWMLEHGIDYELFCWYRPPEGSNFPIKQPRNALALHEGFFNAEYSDKIKFAIAWENGQKATSGSKDFRENIVPFWIEQYFKDPRYLVVDNKPVVSIYKLDGLERDFGSAEAARAELSYLRQACVNAGFSGCVILMTSSTQSAAEMQKMKDMGIDCIYAYTWANGSNVMQDHVPKMMKQRDLGGVNMMPTLGMGWDCTAWERTPGGYAKTEDFAALINWAKEEFMPTLPADSLGRKFVMFDNWNEYGEGHFLSPSNLNGFGYLDEIRKAFTDTEAHEDVRPTEEQRERMNRLYVQDRAVPTPAALRNSGSNGVPENVRLGYTFDTGMEGWTLAKQVENLTAENGVMKGTSVSVDPGIYSPPDLNIKIGDVSHVRIRIRAKAASPQLQLYYITESDQSWNQAKCVQQSFAQSENEMIEVILTMSGAYAWSGVLKQVRLDPLTEMGTFEIDSVEFLCKTKEGDPKLALDGEQQFFSEPLILKNDVMMVPANEFANMLEYTCVNTLNRDGVELLNEDNDYITLMYDETFGMRNGKAFDLSAPASEIDTMAYIPLRSVAEALGFKVEWDSAEHMAKLINPNHAGESVVGSDAPDPVGSFNFNQKDNAQGWAPGGGVANLKVKNGIFSFEATNNDPMFSQNCSLQAEDYPYLHFKVKNKSDGNSFQFFFTASDKPNLSADKSVTAAMSANSNEFVEYTIDMRTNPNWKGTITSLRMDPTNAPGRVELDYVILNNEEKVPEAPVADNLIANGLMDIRELHYTPYQIKGSFSTEQAHTGRYSLLAEKQSSQGAVRIHVPLVENTAYQYQFWVYLPKSGSVSVGTVSENGEAVKLTTKEVAEGSRWVKIEGSFLNKEPVTKPQIYITADTDYFYLDGITLRAMN